MKIIISKRSILYLLLTILFAYTILFPADKLNIKEILLIITLFIGYFGNKIKISLKLIIFALVFPLITIIYALLRGVYLYDALSYGYVWFFLLVIPLIEENKFDLKKVFIIATYIIAIIIDFIMIFDLLNIISIRENFLAKFFINMNEIQGLGKGILATFGYSIFYKSCPLIIITYAYFIYNKKIIKSIPLLIALCASGTRANFLIVLVISIVIPIISFKSKNKKIFVILIVIIVSLYYIPIAYTKMMNLNLLKYSGSEAIKIADANIVISNLSDNFLNLLFGTGVGSSFLSARGYYMSTFELSFIDYLRQVGIFGLLVFIVFIVLIIRKLLVSRNIWLLIAFICYIGVASTNPLLVTSTSFILYVFVICYNNENKKIGGVKNE